MQLADHLRLCIFLRSGVPTTLSGWLLQERMPKMAAAEVGAAFRVGKMWR